MSFDVPFERVLTSKFPLTDTTSEEGLPSVCVFMSLEACQITYPYTAANSLCYLKVLRFPEQSLADAT